jgi:hypothetical protein
MTFVLDVTISGLHLLVHDPARPAVFALMPKVQSTHGAEHAPVVVYNKIYEGEPLSDACEDYRTVSIDGTTLSLGATAADPLRVNFDDDYVANLTAIVRPTLRVPAALVADTLHERVAARVLLWAGSDTRRYGGAAAWEFDERPGQPQRMTSAVRWQVERYETAHLEVPTASGEIRDLYPVNGHVAIAIYHAPPDELPPCPDRKPGPPRRNHRPPHFRAIYWMLGRNKDSPRYRLPALGRTQLFGVSPYTCMLARAEV